LPNDIVAGDKFRTEELDDGAADVKVTPPPTVQAVVTFAVEPPPVVNAS
jgi:hypothetical protein